MPSLAHLLLAGLLGLLSASGILAQSGCTNPLACNFDPNAVIDDGSCAFEVDCSGQCGGNYILDFCGNCYDPNNVGGEDILQFNFTGDMQMLVVPSGVYSIHIDAYGAQGGDNPSPANVGSGGRGGFATGDLSVTPGETIYIYVGGAGSNNGPGGYNGGGNGASSPGGGGASDVRQGGQAFANRVIVAGGGGGAAWETAWGGGWGVNNGTANGGNGGGLTGANGLSWQNSCQGGVGGSQLAGGAAGGTLGLGGNGVASPGDTGGGGGGYYGGGGGGDCTGYNGAGGGGSSYTGGVLNGSTTAGLQSGNGLVIISWTGPAVPECFAGCTDPLACNYDPNAQLEDGSCTYPDGCTDANACNYDPLATCDNGTCLFPGCTDEAACNYQPEAGCDNGNCIYVADCNGVCGGNWISDACGNCYDPLNAGEEFAMTFEYAGSPESYTIPEGVYSIHIEAYGAQGGDNPSPANVGSGGRGGFASGDLSVTPGETIYIYVGGAGSNNGPGGYNGGGNGASSPGGGGASDVRQGGQAFANRVIVAGGGGGAAWETAWGGGWGVNNGTANGGNGGGLTGANGLSWQNSCQGGVGGSQLAGGAAGGTLGLGGNGVASPGDTGGGGGGYYGGGGGGDCTGYNGAGGGGSSYTGGVLNGSTSAGVQSGNGMVIISWTGPAVPECFAGCTNPNADNYDPGANFDDGSCIIPGCTNPEAVNYDPLATQDDGSCSIPGCTYPGAQNFNPQANDDDGSCLFECAVPGCTDATSCNYLAIATVDDGSCEEYPGQPCDDGNPLSVNDIIQLDCDCLGEMNFGCTYPDATNFNALAGVDDGACLFELANACPADINGDSLINTSDLLDLLAQFGTSCN